MAPMRGVQQRFGYVVPVRLEIEITVRSVLLPDLTFPAGRLFPFA